MAEDVSTGEAHTEAGVTETMTQGPAQGDGTREATVLGRGESDRSSGEAEAGSAQESSSEPPGDYQPFQVPEGFEANGERVQAFTELAKAAHLDQATAQGFVDMATDMVQDALQQAVTAQQEAWQQVRQDWDRELRRIPAEQQQDARLFLDRLGATDEFRAFLDQTGFGDHPELVRLLAKAGAAFREDGVLIGGSRAQAPSIADRLFPSSQG